uniref:CLASP_N domain-containing protein n=1 Tax=Macrostomum lignano TaxID=282301 RepID=A0A1I8F4W2_9PLAT
MDSYTGSEADIVRAQIHACLSKLKQYNPVAFRAYLEQLVAGNSMQELVDILHAFTGFCMDPAVHTSPKPGAHHEQKNSYGTNFGQVADGEGTRGSEGIVIASLLRPLLAKFVTYRKELASQENMPKINYLEVHGCTFRRTLLTGLLDCSKNRRDSNGAAARQLGCGEETAATKSPTSRAPSVTSESHRGAAQRGAAQRGGRCDRRSLSPFFTAAATTSDSEGLNDRLGSPGSSDDAEESPCRRAGAAAAECRRIAGKASNRTPMTIQTSKIRCSFVKKLHIMATLRRAAPGVLSADASLQSAGMGGPGGGAGASVMRQRRIINCQLLHSGMSLFRFLLDSCHPGVVPEPQLVAAMLDLEAPVVARACVLLERLANLDALLGPGCKPKRTMAMQRMAGHLFHAWAETLGSRLEYFLKIEVATDRFGSVQEVQDDARRRALQREDEMENFLVDSTVNESGDACPHALKAVAVTLLLEITRFLRDVFPNLPKPKSVSSNRGGRGGGAPAAAESGRNCRPISDEPTSSVGSNVQEFASEELPSAVHSTSGHQAAGHTVSSAAAVAGPRRISFAVPPAASSHSHASGTAATSDGGTSCLLRDGGGCWRRRRRVTSLEVRLTVP